MFCFSEHGVVARFFDVIVYSQMSNVTRTHIRAVAARALLAMTGARGIDYFGAFPSPLFPSVPSLLLEAGPLEVGP